MVLSSTWSQNHQGCSLRAFQSTQWAERVYKLFVSTWNLIIEIILSTSGFFRGLTDIALINWEPKNNIVRATQIELLIIFSRLKHSISIFIYRTKSSKQVNNNYTVFLWPNWILFILKSSKIPIRNVLQILLLVWSLNGFVNTCQESMRSLIYLLTMKWKIEWE